MHFLGHWAQTFLEETAEEFRTTWDKVHDAVVYLVTWGWSIASWERSRAIGVDEFSAAKGTYLTWCIN
jgi:hypothetical protein